MRLPPFIAFRHLRYNLRSTLLTAGGVALGVAVMTIMASLLLGLQSQFVTNVVESTPNVTVEGVAVGTTPRTVAVPGDVVVDLSRRPPPEEERGITAYRQRIALVERVPGVLAAAPVLEGDAILRYGTRGQPVRITGIVPEQQARTVIWTPRLRQQRDQLELTPNGVVLGVELAKNLGIPPGSRVTVIAGPERQERMRVVAFYHSGIRLVDESAVYMNLNTAQTLLDRPSEVSQIAVRVDQVDDAPAIARRIASATGLRARSWQEVNASFFSIFRIQNTMTSVMLSFIVVIAGFGITNGLITLILEKQREIGILKALGTTNARVEAIFLLEGLLMGLLGAVLGIGLAALGVDYLDNLPLAGEGQLSTESTFTMLRNPGVYIVPAMIAVIASIVASLLPVRQAARYDPVEIIRSAK